VNVDKAVLKMQLAQSWGKKIEDLEEKAKADVHRLEGTVGSLRQAAAALEQHRHYYQTATDEGTIDGPTCSTAMDVITRCVGGIQNLSDKAQLKQGELQGIRRGLGILEQDYQAERQRLQAISDMAEYTGRPDTTAAQDIQRRKAEAAEGRSSANAAPTDKEKDMAAKKKKATKKTTKKSPARKSTKKKGSKRSA
jgi:hypothetical protein